MSQPTPSQPKPATAPAAATKPPTDIHPGAHLDSSAYVQGTHNITISANALIHPRALLVSAHGPLSIGANTVISERCVVGGPAPDPRDSNNEGGLADTADSSSPLETLIGSSVVLYPASTVMAGSSIGSASVIEAHAVVAKGVRVGEHAKVCPGCVVDRDVRDWEVVYGDGQMRRKRHRAEGEAYETSRLRSLDKEREGTVATLRMTAVRGAMAKKKT